MSSSDANPTAARDPNDPPEECDGVETERAETVAEIEESDGAQHKRYRIRRDLQKRLDRYLRDRLPALSRSRLQKLINEGAVTVNQRTPKASTLIRDGDVIDVVVPPPPIQQIPPEDIPLRVLHEDDHLIVVNKQADLVVHPARSNQTGTLVNALAYHFRDVRANGLQALSQVGVDEFRPGIVHRLDKDTTGAMVVAKTDEAHWRLHKQFEHRQVQKYYLAIVHGAMTPPGDVIDQPIGKHPQITEAHAVRNDGGGYAREAVSLYRVREVFDGFSLVELELKTGRTHQIRVHLTWLGHPIVSDLIYGGEPLGEPEFHEPPKPAGGQPYLTYARNKEEGKKMWERVMARDDMLLCRPALHAAVLTFDHPITAARMTFTAPLHDDMGDLLRRLRTERPGPYDKPLRAEGAGVEIDQLIS